MAKRSKPEDDVLVDESPPDASTEQETESVGVSSLTDDVSATEGAEAVDTEPAPPKPWQELGLDEDKYGDVEDYQTVAKRLAEERRQYEEQFNQRLAEQQREWQRQTQDWLTQKQWREEQAAKQQKPAETPKWWNPPSGYVKDWRKYVKTDPETGQHVIEAPSEQMKNAVIESAKFYAEHEDRWESDREGYLRSFVEQVFPDLMQQHFSAFHEQQVEGQRLSQLENESARWLYQWDGDPESGGQMVRDPSGDPFLSAVGVDVMNYARQLHQRGLGSQSECFVAARDAIMGRHLLQERLNSESAAKAKKKSDERKLDVLDANAKRRTNRNGSDGKAETRDAPAQTANSRSLFASMFDSLSSPDGSFDPLASYR